MCVTRNMILVEHDTLRVQYMLEARRVRTAYIMNRARQQQTLKRTFNQTVIIKRHTTQNENTLKPKA